MPLYRFSVPASVCFDITADTDTEAADLARKYVQDLSDGFGLRDFPCSCGHNPCECGDLRCYPDETATPSLDDKDDEGAPACDECGEPFHVDGSGVATHADDDAPDGIDHDADADHTARKEGP